MDDCVFCKIVKGDIPSTKVFEDDQVVAFKDIKPLAPVHILIIPKTHIESLSKAEDEYASLLGICQITAKKVAEKMGIKDAFRLLLANGSSAGQTVFHLHYHLLGGWGKEVPEMEVKKEKLP